MRNKKIFLLSGLCLYLNLAIAFGENRVRLNNGLKTTIAVKGRDEGGCSILPFELYLKNKMIEGDVIIKCPTKKRLTEELVMGTTAEIVVGTLEEYYKHQMGIGNSAQSGYFDVVDRLVRAGKAEWHPNDGRGYGDLVVFIADKEND